MNFTTGEIVSVLVAMLAGGVAVGAEVIRRRTPSIEKEADQEDQWRKELWEINRTLSADLDATQKDLKATRKVLEQAEAQTAILQQQCDMLKHEKEAWVLERADMKAEVTALKRDVFDLTREVNTLRRAHDRRGTKPDA